jgi:single-stranded-DNA-specific exonuclease RecJ
VRIKEHTEWIISTPDTALAETLAGALKVTSLIGGLLINRGIVDREEGARFLFGTAADLHSPHLLAGLPEALLCIREALDQNKGIRVFGDYDVDGVTSTVLLLLCLREAGGRADYYIPHRVDEGYGLSCASIEKAAAEGTGLIITVDCGVSDCVPIARARELGMHVVVVDHHEVPEDLPCASAIINPRRKDCAYPYKNLAGVGVTFKLAVAINEMQGLPFPSQYLDLVALGTIGDVVPLTGENRIMVKEGILLLDRGALPGIAALRERMPRRPNTSAVKDISFNLIPPLNAAGRMERAALAVDLLLCQNPGEALRRAQELEELNRERQRVEERIRKEALSLIEKRPREHLEGRVLVMAREGWNTGVLGISASRLATRLGKPVFLIGLREGKGRGSARSACNIDLFELMKGAGELFLNYGGHAGAGGFDIEENKIGLLKIRLEEQLEQESSFIRTSHPHLDMETTLDHITTRLVEELRMLEPHGEGNPEPLFMLRGITLRDLQTVGGDSHLKLTLTHENCSLDGIAFHCGPLKEELRHEDLLYDVVLVPEIDAYRGRERLTGRILDIHYPDRNSSLMVSEPHMVLCQDEERENEGGSSPLIINSRNVRNRTKYLKSLSLHTCSGVILSRTHAELERLHTALLREGIEAPLVTGNGTLYDHGAAPPRWLILSFPHFLKELDERQDVLFYSPPPSLLHFNNPFYRNVKRIHFLFNHHHLDREERLRALMELTEEKLATIMAIVRKHSVGGFFKENPEKVVKIARDDRIKKITTELAFKILKELDILVEKEKGEYSVRERELTGELLESSRLFVALREERRSFSRFRLLYRDSFATLTEEILAAIKGREPVSC